MKNPTVVAVFFRGDDRWCPAEDFFYILKTPTVFDKILDMMARGRL
jgi:hypothetical protein